MAIHHFPSADALPAEEQELVEAAHRATQLAHAPYSHFLVGSAIRLADGSIVQGSDQENASYGLSICAERTALYGMANAGKKRDMRTIAVVGRMADMSPSSIGATPVTPCGACRQVIKEYEDLAGVPAVILCCAWKGKVVRCEGVDALLPMGFGAADVGVHV